MSHRSGRDTWVWFPRPPIKHNQPGHTPHPGTRQPTEKWPPVDSQACCGRAGRYCWTPRGGLGRRGPSLGGRPRGSAAGSRSPECSVTRGTFASCRVRLVLGPWGRGGLYSLPPSPPSPPSLPSLPQCTRSNQNVWIPTLKPRK